LVTSAQWPHKSKARIDLFAEAPSRFVKQADACAKFEPKSAFGFFILCGKQICLQLRVLHDVQTPEVAGVATRSDCAVI